MFSTVTDTALNANSLAQLRAVLGDIPRPRAYRDEVTEQQPYDLVERRRGYELRRYPASVVAEVSVDAPFEQAGNMAFSPLVTYIGGKNRTQESLAMTAPVVQSQKMAMTAPVVQTATTSNRQVVAFVLPSSVTLDSAPVPTDPRVVVREVPASLTAVIQYSGRWTQRSYQDHLRELLDALSADGLTPIGEPRFARFDPPFTPWFMRHNEVQIDVVDES